MIKSKLAPAWHGRIRLRGDAPRCERQGGSTATSNPRFLQATADHSPIRSTILREAAGRHRLPDHDATEVDWCRRLVERHRQGTKLKDLEVQSPNREFVARSFIHPSTLVCQRPPSALARSVLPRLVDDDLYSSRGRQALTKCGSTVCCNRFEAAAEDPQAYRRP
jgi:hypothetical protein